jgi:hypothetical protein
LLHWLGVFFFFFFFFSVLQPQSHQIQPNPTRPTIAPRSLLSLFIALSFVFSPLKKIEFLLLCMAAVFESNLLSTPFVLPFFLPFFAVFSAVFCRFLPFFFSFFSVVRALDATNASRVPRAPFDRAYFDRPAHILFVRPPHSHYSANPANPDGRDARAADRGSQGDDGRGGGRGSDRQSAQHGGLAEILIN